MLLFDVDQHDASEIGVLNGDATASCDSHTLIHFVDRAEVRLLLSKASSAGTMHEKASPRQTLEIEFRIGPPLLS